MPRAARTKSESGFYHVVLRGNGQQLLFEGDADREAFLSMLARTAKAHGVTIHGWCLMNNHVHLLLQDPDDQLSAAMGSLSTSYAQRFNTCGGHVGHVFQQRFKSQPIEDDGYLLQALRYIHNNPAKAGVCPASEYYWSSYREYVGAPFITDTKMILEMTGGVEGFITFSSADDCSYRFGQSTRLPDSLVNQIAAAVLGDIKPLDLKGMEKGARNELLYRLREQGLSVRQIARLTGIGVNVINRAAK